MKTKRLKKILIAGATVLVLVICAGLIYVGNFLFDFALNPDAEYTMGDTFTEPADEEVSAETEPEVLADDVIEWREFCNQAYEWFAAERRSVTMESEDGLSLHSWQIDNQGHRYAIVCHGYTSKPSDMAPFAKKFYDMGFSVMLPAAMAHEESGGDYIGMGWQERKHILQWIDTIIAEDPDAEIMLMGISMGGATVMMTAGEDLPENVKCIIEDCGYSSVWDEFELQLKAVFGLPSFPILNAANLVCNVRADYDFKEASSVEQLKKAEVPMLFIHGEEDTFVPYSMLQVVYDACASDDKEMLSVPGAPHGASAGTQPTLYWETAEAFIGKYFG